MRLRNNSPLGDIEISGVGTVKAGAVFEVTGAVAEDLQRQGFPRVGVPRKNNKPKAKPRTATKPQPKAAAARRSSTHNPEGNQA